LKVPLEKSKTEEDILEGYDENSQIQNQGQATTSNQSPSHQKYSFSAKVLLGWNTYKTKIPKGFFLGAMLYNA